MLEFTTTRRKKVDRKKSTITKLTMVVVVVVVVVHRNFVNKRKISIITIMQKYPTSIRLQRHQHPQQQQQQQQYQQPIYTTAVASIIAKIQLTIWEPLQRVIVNNNLHRKLAQNSDGKLNCLMWRERCDFIHFDLVYVCVCMRACV